MDQATGYLRALFVQNCTVHLVTSPQPVFEPKGKLSDFLEKETSEKNVFYVKISFFPMMFHFFGENSKKISVPLLDFEPIKLLQVWYLVHPLILSKDAMKSWKAGYGIAA
jgi:hypothetical protein